jgi:hypothetical protein
MISGISAAVAAAGQREAKDLNGHVGRALSIPFTR